MKPQDRHLAGKEQAHHLVVKQETTTQKNESPLVT